MSKGITCELDSPDKIEENTKEFYEKYELNSENPIKYLAWPDTRKFKIDHRIDF